MDSEETHNTVLVILDRVGDMSDQLCEQLKPFGFDLIFADGPAALGDLISETGAEHVLIRTRIKENGGVNAAVTELTHRENAPSVLYLSDDISLEARIAAVRAGASAYLATPANALEIVDRLEEMRPNLSEDPYRVMIVDDDVTLSKFYDAVLTASGMVTRVINDPTKVLDQLPDFRPELILMDHYMPDVQGRELAAVIRQEPAYDSIPIVFLSAEDDTAMQQKVMQIGGDDFLTKPIRPDHLVGAVVNRARRFRALRSTMMRDSLTGLLNHTATKEHLAVDLNRMRRAEKPLCFALIDIDRFKEINDTYGHPTGDRVLKSLAYLLKQRLRTTDVIGRYGGEEFAVALPETPIDQARHVLDEVRVSFALLPHASETGDFNVTFSCGVATFPGHDDATVLTDAADKALYRAKEAGRNRIVVD